MSGEIATMNKESDLRDRLLVLADELDAAASPFLMGSMFFDAAPTTRLRARASVRRDVAAQLRALIRAELAAPSGEAAEPTPEAGP